MRRNHLLSVCLRSISVVRVTTCKTFVPGLIFFSQTLPADLHRVEGSRDRSQLTRYRLKDFRWPPIPSEEKVGL